MFFLKTFLKYFKHFVKVLTETSHTNIRGEQITPKSSWSLVFPLCTTYYIRDYSCRGFNLKIDRGPMGEKTIKTS